MPVVELVSSAKLLKQSETTLHSTFLFLQMALVNMEHFDLISVSSTVTVITIAFMLTSVV